MAGQTGPNSIDSSEVGIFRLNANEAILFGHPVRSFPQR